MGTMSLRLSESLHQAAKELAKREGISVNQLVTTALAEKLAALMTVEYLGRANRGNREKSLAAMARAPDVEPEVWDRLPAGMAPNQRLQPTEAQRQAKARKRKK
jgi:hypothetical protein